MSTKTPETDTFAERLIPRDSSNQPRYLDALRDWGDFARSLELRNAELTARIAELERRNHNLLSLIYQSFIYDQEMQQLRAGEGAGVVQQGSSQADGICGSLQGLPSSPLPRSGQEAISSDRKAPNATETEGEISLQVPRTVTPKSTSEEAQETRSIQGSVQEGNAQGGQGWDYHQAETLRGLWRREGFARASQGLHRSITGGLAMSELSWHQASEAVRGLLRDVIEYSAEARKDGQWRDIATAPKDGTTVDLIVNGHRIADCAWGKPTHECGEAGEYCDSDWHGAKKGWFDTTFNWFIDTKPTHWKAIILPATPLPEKP